MKAPLKARRPSPDEALAIAATTAPQHPPTQITSPPPLPRAAEMPTPAAVPAAPPPHSDPATTLNLRVRMSTIDALIDVAKEKGLTMKQVVSHALKAAGVAVAEADLEDRTPRRK
jgi:hypothetical protein